MQNAKIPQSASKTNIQALQEWYYTRFTAELGYFHILVNESDFLLAFVDPYCFSDNLNFPLYSNVGVEENSHITTGHMSLSIDKCMTELIILCYISKPTFVLQSLVFVSLAV